ncbi:hypothetical protein TrVE_jg4954 [Triparma verrucosa]|uniref:Voltage-gated hydrogen channel 1 n=1 Tax=Triparma verrucosa TaxID=1606542 RepID=A0A9W7KTX8_9STRA|nr:hypothetical protein TrVE_jg4954 [Triparma verrucosa]
MFRLAKRVDEHKERNKRLGYLGFVVQTDAHHEPWRKHLAHNLESYKFEMLVVLCLVLDVWCVFLEIMSAENGLNRDLKWVRGLVTFAGVLSKTIVILFVVDVLLHICAFGFRHWLANRLYVLDGFVVLVTFILEFIVHPLVHSGGRGGGHRLLEEEGGVGGGDAERNTEAAELVVVIIRSWRFIRLFHGLAFSEKLRHDEHLKQLDEKVELENLEEQLKEENERLKARVEELGEGEKGKA